MQIVIYKKQRPAIAMIELIFAIVVMGITLMSAPMLIERATKSTYVALQQESITAGATQLSMIMTTLWDHNDLNNTNYMPVLTTASTAIPNCTGITPPGVSNINGRYCKDIGGSNPFYVASDIKKDSNFSDIDDFNGSSTDITLYATENALSDYIDKNISILSNVYYGVDTPMKSDGDPSTGGYDKDTTFSNPFRTSSATTTHIKLITITLTSNNTATELSDKKVFLSAFMCNIGAPRMLVNNKAGL